MASPGFELNDLGYLDRADFRSVAAGIGYQQQQAGAHLRDWSVQATANDAWNFGGDNVQQGYGLYGVADLASFWAVNGGLSASRAVLSDRFTRGGPLAKLPAGYTASLGLTSDSRRPLVAGVKLAYARDGSGTTTHSAGLALDLRPSASVHLSLGPQWEADRVTAQYVATVADPLAAATYGSRYVFADLRQTTVSLTARLDWTFSPTLSLQLFAQPFVAAGSYAGYSEFLQPRGYRFGVYGRDRGTIAPADGGWRVDPDGAGAAPAFTLAAPDFDVRSLRGNAVLRWEYRPGSALFFVWQQERDGFSPDGAFRLGPDVGALFRSPARNVFLVKATCWLGH